MKNGKAPRQSGVVTEMFKCSGEVGIEWPVHLSNSVIEDNKIPADWK
jgi:hypothetical protein